MFIFSVLVVMIVEFINWYVFWDNKNDMYLYIDLLRNLWFEDNIKC